MNVIEFGKSNRLYFDRITERPTKDLPKIGLAWNRCYGLRYDRIYNKMTYRLTAGVAGLILCSANVQVDGIRAG